MKPLEGIKVLDLTQFVSGPFCTMILSDMGAEVIKLERPPFGDINRWVPMQNGGIGTYFASMSRGKKSVLMDLGAPEQKEAFLKMVKDADVVVENYKPGTMDKLGCGYEVLKKINPGLVYTAISGFGQDGPMAKLPAFDLTIQGASGLMSVTGPIGGEPLVVGVSIGDITTGIYGALGTISALYSKKCTGEGQYVDVCMLESVMSLLDDAIGRYGIDGTIVKPNGNRHPNAAPFQPFKTKGGELVFICTVTEDQWAGCANALGHPEWATDPRFASTTLRIGEVETIQKMIDEVVCDMDPDELVDAMLKNGVVAGRVSNVGQLYENPQVVARKSLIDVVYEGQYRFKAPGSPIRLSGTERQTEFVSPKIGSSTLEIMKQYFDEKTFNEYYIPYIEAANKKIDERLGK